jgi:GNAT superfamily N-acetyltransferase
MVNVAVPNNLGLLRSLISSGAREGSWDPALATPGPAVDGLVSKIGYALQHGALPQFDPRSGKWIVTRINGWVFRSDERASPIGFGLFKEWYGDGFELWLCAIEPSRRGAGLGRKMLGELMATPAGRRAQLARCALGTDGGRRCARVLRSLDFVTCRRTTHEEWLLRKSTPPGLFQRLATMDMSAYEPAAPRPPTAPLLNS